MRGLKLRRSLEREHVSTTTRRLRRHFSSFEEGRKVQAGFAVPPGRGIQAGFAMPPLVLSRTVIADATTLATSARLDGTIMVLFAFARLPKAPM